MAEVSGCLQYYKSLGTLVRGVSPRTVGDSEVRASVYILTPVTLFTLVQRGSPSLILLNPEKGGEDPPNRRFF